MSALRGWAPFLPGLPVLLLLCASAPAQVPAWLSRYTLDIHLDVAGHTVRVRQRVAWTNRHTRPAEELVFNVHSHYKLPDAEVGMTAKMFEILRNMPGETLDLEGHACDVQKVTLVGISRPPAVIPAGGQVAAEPQGDTPLPAPRRLPAPADTPLPAPRPLPIPDDTPLPSPRTLPDADRQLTFNYQDKSDTALEVKLPRPVRPGETVTVDLEFVLKLPEKQGRWGHWKDVTFLTNWTPVLAYYDEKGWEPVPYVVWHQGFYNEAGLWTVRLTLPDGQKVAATAPVRAEKDAGGGLRQIDFAPCPARDFAIVCSARFHEHTEQAGKVRVRCLAFREHDFYAQAMARFAADALAAFARWFGPYPYPEFTIAESYFGWNNNECSGLILVDERIFGMPHMASGFVDFLVAQATCHQWWYNVVGTHGYAETWMSKGLATYFAYRLMESKYGKGDFLVKYPRGLRWLPNVRRDDFRYFGLYGTLGRGENMATIQDIPKFVHIANLTSLAYDRGGKVVGMIETRLGEKAFFDFMRRLYARYHFRILRVADFRRELEDFTGRPWAAFFKDWLYGKGMSDWAVEKVTIDDGQTWTDRLIPGRPPPTGPCRVTVLLRQKAENNEPTALGFSFDGGKTYPVRVPVLYQDRPVKREAYHSLVESLPDNRVRVTAELPRRPDQIAVDPDQILVDPNPTNNFWKARYHFRLTPVFTFLDENDLTNYYDRWNFVAGPWIFAPTYDNPFFTRSTRFGVRAGAYRTQFFEGGVYAAYRTDYRDLVTGIDAIWYHCPWAPIELGFVGERRLAGTLAGETEANRGVVYGRYVLDYGDSLYLPPFHYAEAFFTITDNLLPFARETVPGAERYSHQGMGGLHYHINYLTPYWDAEGGFALDVTYAAGLDVPGVNAGIHGAQQFTGQLSGVLCMPDGLGWFSDTRLALRGYGAVGVPSKVQYFAMGGGELFRGFDLAQRQGSLMWVGSLEWRVPLVQHVNWSCLDHSLGIRNIYGVAFCDVGDVFLRGESIGGITEAVGGGLRLDVAWFTFVERTILRLDLAKTVNVNTPWQVWVGIEHPF